MTTVEEREQMQLSLLTRIANGIDKLVAIAEKKKAAGTPEVEVATDSDLDGQYGDPVIRKDPNRWSGESYVGSRYSQTTPEYLEEVASLKDWQADKDDRSNAVDDQGRKKSRWARKDAKLARGWAKRLRAGWKPAQVEAATGTDDFGADDDFGGRF